MASDFPILGGRVDFKSRALVNSAVTLEIFNEFSSNAISRGAPSAENRTGQFWLCSQLKPSSTEEPGNLDPDLVSWVPASFNRGAGGMLRERDEVGKKGALASGRSRREPEEGKVWSPT